MSSLRRITNGGNEENTPPPPPYVGPLSNDEYLAHLKRKLPLAKNKRLLEMRGADQRDETAELLAFEEMNGILIELYEMYGKKVEAIERYKEKIKNHTDTIAKLSKTNEACSEKIAQLSAANETLLDKISKLQLELEQERKKREE